MKINININSFIAEIKPVIRHDSIKAFVTWIFKTDSGEWIIRGGTIKEKPFGKNQKIIKTFDPPAIKTRSGFYKVIFIDNKELYIKLCHASVDAYLQETGEVHDDIVFGDEINSEDVPF